jgi:hypothetical protein
VDKENTVIAIVDKTLYIRRKLTKAS